MTYQQAAQSALDVQDACNLSGVVFSFAEAMHAICEEQCRLNQGTEWKNRNPIVTLYLSKLSELNGLGWIEPQYGYCFRRASAARSLVKAIAEGRDAQAQVSN